LSLPRLLRRLLSALLTLLILVVLCFSLVRLVPGGPFDEESHLSTAVREYQQHTYGFDRSLPQQLGLYVLQLVQGDLGLSTLFQGQSVVVVISRVLPTSLNLGLLVLALSWFGGIGLGTIAFQNKSQKIVRFLHWLFLAAPTLFLGPVLILIFSIWWNLLPAAVDSRWQSWVLPVLVLAIRPTANIARLLMSGLDESLAQPWVQTAMAYGISQKRIIGRLAFRQSLIPTLAYLGPAIAGIFSGSVIVESIFNIQGLGSLFAQALLNRDYNLTVALTLFYGSILIGINVLIDAVMWRFEPRMESAL